LAEKLIVAGLDDAGRGPVIGPLVIAGVAVKKEDVLKLALINVKDSKMLSPEAREKLSIAIKQIVDKYSFIEFSPREIDEFVFKSKKLEKLNFLEAKGMAQVIIKLKPDLAYVDASDVNTERFAKQILENLPFKVKIVSEHYADKKYPIVSAASILAKVHRDKRIEELKEKYGDFGSLPYSEEILIAKENGEIDLVNIGKLVENKLKEINNDEKIYAFSIDPESLKIKLFQITDFIKHSPQKIFKLTLSDNREVKVSSSHSFFKLNGFKLEEAKASDLKIGDYIASASRVNLTNITEEFNKVNFGKKLIEKQMWLNLLHENNRKQNRFLIQWRENLSSYLFKSDIQLVKVVKIEDTKRFEPVYDIEVKPKGRFIENFLGGLSGVILHNSGYPSDPKTINFLKKWYKENGDFPSIARKSWKTLKKIKDEFSQKKLI
jgi:ribonuclease HII